MEWRLAVATLLLGVLLSCVLYLAFQVIPPERTIIEVEKEPKPHVLESKEIEAGADVRTAMFPMDIGSNKYVDASGNIAYPF
jgi:hypothetical protein